MSLKFRLLLLALVPLFCLILFAGRATLENTSRAREMEDVEDLARLAAAIGALVHELQKERGMSAGFIGSKGTNFASELPQQRSEVDTKRTGFSAQLAEFNAGRFDQRLQAHLAEAGRQLTELVTTRQSVSDLRLSGSQAIAFYSKTIGSLLAVVGQSPSMSSETDVARVASAYNALLRGKEFAGIERATLSNVFGVDRFASEMFVRFLGISSAQQTWFEVFQLYADASQTSYFASQVSGPAVDEVVRIKQAAIENAQNPSLGMDAKAWFGRSTERIDLLKKVEDKLAVDLVNLAAARRADARLMMLASLGLTLLAVGLTLLVGYRLIRDILRQIGGEPSQAAEIARRIAEGDLAHEVSVAAADTTSLLSAMQVMHRKLVHILVSIEESGRHMGQSAFQISTISTDIAETTRLEESRSAAVAEATQSLTQIADGVKQQAETAAERTRQVEQQAHDGVGAVERNIAELDSVTGEVSRAAGEVTELSHAADKITQIIEAIREIAGQTNLLALNAAIEAARAGEQGRGFAVVADEVRKLAERTASSSLKVGEIVGEITSRVQDLQQAMQALVARVERSQQVAGETAKAINSMAAGVSEAARSNDAIAEESRHQMTQIEQLGALLKHLFATLADSAAKVEATAHIGADLHQASCDLNDLMAGFNFNRQTLIATAANDERRAYPRLERGVLTRVDTESGASLECLAMDVSLTGARLVMSRRLPENARLRLSVFLPQPDLDQYRRQQPVAINALVRWQRADGDRFLCGVEFEHPTAIEQARIKAIFAFYNKSSEH